MKSSLIFVLLAFAPLVQSVTFEPYVYLVYRDSDTCSGGSADTVQGFVSGDTFTITGATADLCATETLCLVNSESPQCLAITDTTTVNANFTVNDDGSIYQCDDSNSGIGLEECLLFDECEASSVYPSCHYTANLKSELAQDPRLLSNPNPSPAARGQVYLVYHNDDTCNDLAGLQSLIVGDTEVTTVPDESVSCEDSMACLVQPNGSTCQAIPNTSTANVTTETRNNGRDVFGCDDEGICEDRDPTACVKSSIFPNCHYHIVSAIRLLEDPVKFLTNITDTDSGTDAPTQAPTMSGAAPITMASVAWMTIFVLACAW
jgi:hypothetical protein